MSTGLYAGMYLTTYERRTEDKRRAHRYLAPTLFLLPDAFFRPRRISMDDAKTRGRAPEAYRVYSEDAAAPRSTKLGAKSARPS